MKIRKLLTINTIGFSLIELLISLTILGIISAIVVPSYKDYVTKAKVSKLISVLFDAFSAYKREAATQGINYPDYFIYNNHAIYRGISDSFTLPTPINGVNSISYYWDTNAGTDLCINFTGIATGFSTLTAFCLRYANNGNMRCGLWDLGEGSTSGGTIIFKRYTPENCQCPSTSGGGTGCAY